MYRIEQGSGELKAGFTVSSKSFSRAVDRNRIKRLVRESYRLQKITLESLVAKNKYSLQLFFIYTGKEIIPFIDVSKRVKQVLEKLTEILHEKHIENT